MYSQKGRMSKLGHNYDTDYSKDGSKFRSANDAILVELKQSEHTGRITAVVGLGDAVSSYGLRESVQSLERDYTAHLSDWRDQMMKIKRPNASHVARWHLADAIVTFANNAKRKGLQVANLREALIRDLPIPKSSLGYLIKFRERYATPDHLNPRLSWSIYRELLDFKNVAEMRKCEDLLRKGRVRSTSEIRRICNAANGNRT